MVWQWCSRCFSRQPPRKSSGEDVEQHGLLQTTTADEETASGASVDSDSEPQQTSAGESESDADSTGERECDEEQEVADQVVQHTKTFSFEELHEALRNAEDDKDFVRLWDGYARDAELDAATKQKITEMCLNVACWRGFHHFVEHVINAGVNPNKCFKHELLVAARTGHVKVVHALVKARASLNLAHEHLRAALEDALMRAMKRRGDDTRWEIVAVLANCVGGVNVITVFGSTPLMCALQHGASETAIAKILSLGADVNAVDKYGQPSLHLASRGYKATIVDQLLKAGADCQATDRDGRTALHFAGSRAIASCLLDAGADPLMVDKLGRTPLHVASASHRHEVVELLLTRSVSSYTVDKDGYDPLHMALFGSWRGYLFHSGLKTLQVLIAHGKMWDATCDAIADQIVEWPAKIGSKGIRHAEDWPQQAPAIRACVERWAEEHAQGLPLTDIPVEDVNRGVEATMTYIKEAVASRHLTFRRKICIVGPSCWGKTSLVKSLTAGKPSLEHRDVRTIGIDHFKLAFDEQLDHLNATKKHEVTFWDFAGQDAYQVAHSLFFSGRTLYIVCIDLESFVLARMQADLMTDTDAEASTWVNDFIDAKILRWIRVICARQLDAEFLFVATKKDRVQAVDLDGIIADLEKRMENVAVIIQEMKKEVEKRRGSTADATKRAADNLPITHLGDRRLALFPKKQPVRIIVTSCVTLADVEEFKTTMQEVIQTSNRGYPMPEKYSRVLEALVKMRVAASAMATDERLERSFIDLDRLVHALIEQVRGLDLADESSSQAEADHDAEPYLDEGACRTILGTLRDLGDVLWYDNIDDAELKNKIILDPMLMLDLVREVFHHKRTAEVMMHHTLRSLKYWRHLEGTPGMLSMKRVLHHFDLVYPTTGQVTATSDLIVPAYWKSNKCAFWLFGGRDLRFGRGVDREDVAVRVHWEFSFVNNYPDTLFDHLVVASYSGFHERDVGPDWIMYMNKDTYACRLMVGRDVDTHHHTFHLEALQGHTATSDEKEHLWDCFLLLLQSLERVIRGYPGVVVTRYVRQDDAAATEKPPLNLETLAASKLSVPSRKWMPPETLLEKYLKQQEGRW